MMKLRKGMHKDGTFSNNSHRMCKSWGRNEGQPEFLPDEWDRDKAAEEIWKIANQRADPFPSLFE
jgi:hypothetical protein